MEQQIISLICLLVGYILGIYPYRKNNVQQNYEDMKGFANAYSELCIQMFNQNKITMPEGKQQILGFPFGQNKLQIEEPEADENFDLAGGRI